MNGISGDVERGRASKGNLPEVALTYSWQDVNVYADPPKGCCGRNKGGEPKQILKNGNNFEQKQRIFGLMSSHINWSRNYIKSKFEALKKVILKQQSNQLLVSRLLNEMFICRQYCLLLFCSRMTCFR